MAMPMPPSANRPRPAAPAIGSVSSTGAAVVSTAAVSSTGIAPGSTMVPVGGGTGIAFAVASLIGVALAGAAAAGSLVARRVVVVVVLVRVAVWRVVVAFFAGAAVVA